MRNIVNEVISVVVFGLMSTSVDGAAEVILGYGSGAGKGDACAAAKYEAEQGCVGDGKVKGFTLCEACDCPDERGRYNCSTAATCDHPDAKRE